MDNIRVNILIGVPKNFLWKIGVQKAISSMPWYSIIGEYASGEEIIAVCRETPTRLLILDQQLNDMTAVELHQRLLTEQIDIPILLIGDNKTVETEISELFQLGIKGYILNNCTEEQLMDAISHVSRNKEWCSPTCNPKLFISKRFSNKFDHTQKKITHREHEILNLMMKGHNNSEISDLLCLSVNTVQNHICNIYSKLGVRERLKAVNYALKEGLIEA